MQSKQTIWMIKDHRDHKDTECVDKVYAERKDAEEHVMFVLKDWEGYVSDYEISSNTGTYSNYGCTLIENDIRGTVFTIQEVEVVENAD